MEKQNPIMVVSLFSGCGGMDLGFFGEFEFLGKKYKKTNFNIIRANEINAAACNTYRSNIGNHIIDGDIRETIAELPETADVVIGGFSCQDISVNGKMEGIKGKQSGLYTFLVEAVKKIQPKMFIAENVKKACLIFGKMGGTPEVKWDDCEKSVIHVRASHAPRFEVEISADCPLFELTGIRYDAFRKLPMEEKMRYIREYARSRLQKGERLWWLPDNANAEHTLPIQARLYTTLSTEEKTKLRAEAVLLCPGIMQSGRAKNKYDDAMLYLLTYHGVICHQARDLFSAGSVANPDNDDEGGIYIERFLKLIEKEMIEAALTMDGALFVEYWGESAPPKQRIKKWLEKADILARDWIPSKSLFLNYTFK
jgi:hypothetical protein